MAEEFSSGDTECFYLRNSLLKAKQREKLFMWEQELCDSCRAGASQAFQVFLLEFVTISWSSSALWILVMSNLSDPALEHIETHFGLGFDTIFSISWHLLTFLRAAWNGKSILSLSARKLNGCLP